MATGQPCIDSCPMKSPPLAEVFRRFESEAQRGVVDTGRYHCRYFTWGQGPPLVFIHGLGDVARGYVPLAARLAGSFRCIAYDLPTGRGDRARWTYCTHENLAKDVFVLLDHLGLKQAYVLGSSFGSTIALSAMHAWPERMPRAILAGGFARRPLAPAERFVAGMARWWPGLMRRLPLRAAVSRQAYGPLAERSPEAYGFFLKTTGLAPIAAVARRALDVHRLDLRPLLPRIAQPVLLICGEADFIVSRACEEELLAGLPRGRRIELSGCGHLAHYSHPDMLAEVVRAFLTPPVAELE